MGRVPCTCPPKSPLDPHLGPAGWISHFLFLPPFWILLSAFSIDTLLWSAASFSVKPVGGSKKPWETFKVERPPVRKETLAEPLESCQEPFLPSWQMAKQSLKKRAQARAGRTGKGNGAVLP